MYDVTDKLLYFKLLSLQCICIVNASIVLLHKRWQEMYLTLHYFSVPVSGK